MSTVIQAPPPAVAVAQPAVPAVPVAPAVPAVAPAAPRLRPATIAPNPNPVPPALSPTTASALGLPPATNPQDDYLNNLLAVDSSNSYSGDSGWSFEWSFSSLFSFSWIGLFGYLMRVGILFGLIFLFTSVIPQQELELNTRLLIAGTVVLFYALLDVFRTILAKIKAAMCSAACGCS